MRVGTRLYFAVLPAIFGVLTVAGLAYWGERGRQAPSTVIVIAVVASVASLAIAWRNARYVARRVAQLAQARRSPTVASRQTLGERLPDELDDIEATVSRAAEYAELLDGAVQSMRSSLEQARLPLHILLSSPFGELNENQEEMLDAAQRAVDDADADLARLRKLVDIDRRTVTLAPTRMSVGELLRAPVAIAKARATRTGVRVAATVQDSLPYVSVDSLYTQEALTALISNAVSSASAGAEIVVRAAEGKPGRVMLTICPAVVSSPEPLDVRLAKRVFAHQGAAVTGSADGWAIDLEAEHLVLSQTAQDQSMAVSESYARY